MVMLKSPTAYNFLRGKFIQLEWSQKIQTDLGTWATPWGAARTKAVRGRERHFSWRHQQVAPIIMGAWRLRWDGRVLAGDGQREPTNQTSLNSLRLNCAHSTLPNTSLQACPSSITWLMIPTYRSLSESSFSCLTLVHTENGRLFSPVLSSAEQKAHFMESASKEHELILTPNLVPVENFKL